MRDKLGKGLMILGAVLICAALSLFVYNRWEDKTAGEAADAVLGQLHDVLDQESDQSANVSSPSPYDTEMRVEIIDGYGYVGYLSIPNVGLELPVMSEWDYDRLAITPCRYSGSTKSDDLVIVGHNNFRHLGVLKSLNMDELVIFTDMDKIKTVYKVVAIEILGPTDVLDMVESEYDLTIFTCTIGGANRVTVRCNLVE